jgi:hypothetical protein
VVQDGSEDPEWRSTSFAPTTTTIAVAVNIAIAIIAIAIAASAGSIDHAITLLGGVMLLYELLLSVMLLFIRERER